MYAKSTQMCKALLMMIQPDLVEDDGHEEEVEQECLRGTAAVKLKEDDGEDECEELVAGIAEGGSKKLHPSNCHQQDITAGARHRHLSHSGAEAAYSQAQQKPIRVTLPSANTNTMLSNMCY